MKKVLIIAYNFPPAGGAGVQRTAKFCKYLPQFGWNSVVLTANEDVYSIKDISLLNEMDSNIPIIRVDYFDYNKYIIKLKKLKLNKIIAFINKVMNIPDNKIFWNYNLEKVISNIIIDNNIDLVYISCAPFSTSLLAAYIKKYFSVPVVVDFRDPWAYDKKGKFLPGYRIFNRWLEKKVLDNIDGLITVSAPILNDFITKNCFKKLSLVITNGYDEGDIITNSNYNSKNTNKLLITYIGTFNSVRTPKTFFASLDMLNRNKLIDFNDIEVVLVGHHSEYEHYREYINCVGYVNHDNIKQYIYNTDFLLLVIPSEDSNGYTGKIFEYIASGKPILGLLPNGVAKELIEKTNSGIVCNIDDVNDISEKIMYIYNSWKLKRIDYKPNYDEIKKYSRKELTKKLALFFNSVLNEYNNL